MRGACETDGERLQRVSNWPWKATFAVDGDHLADWPFKGVYQESVWG